MTPITAVFQFKIQYEIIISFKNLDLHPADFVTKPKNDFAQRNYRKMAVLLGWEIFAGKGETEGMGVGVEKLQSWLIVF